MSRRSAKPHLTKRRGPGSALVVIVVFLALLGSAAVSGVVPLILVAGYLLMSVVSFGMYGLDKSAARKGAWRTAEATLQLMAVAGGWPGALLAQRVFRHKTSKQPFQLIFWLAVAVNCAALLWLLFSEAGTKMLAWPAFSW